MSKDVWACWNDGQPPKSKKWQKADDSTSQSMNKEWWKVNYQRSQSMKEQRLKTILQRLKVQDNKHQSSKIKITKRDLNYHPLGGDC